MMKKNRDSVASIPESFTWIFRIRPQAETASEVSIELLEYVSMVLDASSDFFRTMSAQIPISCYPEDTKIIEPLEERPEHHFGLSLRSNPDSTRLGRSSDYKVTGDNLEAVINSFQCPGETVKYVRMVLLDGGETKFTMSDGDHWVSRDSDRYLFFKDGEPIEIEHTDDPLYFEFYHRRDVENRDLSYYDIEVWTTTDIWFEDSEIGRANRDRLTQFLQTVANLPNVVRIEGWSEDYRFSDDDVRELALAPTDKD